MDGRPDHELVARLDAARAASGHELERAEVLNLTGGLPERLRHRTSHGICPECLERVAAGSGAARG